MLQSATMTRPRNALRAWGACLSLRSNLLFSCYVPAAAFSRSDSQPFGLSAGSSRRGTTPSSRAVAPLWTRRWKARASLMTMDIRASRALRLRLRATSLRSIGCWRRETGTIQMMARDIGRTRRRSIKRRRNTSEEHALSFSFQISGVNPCFPLRFDPY